MITIEYNTNTGETKHRQFVSWEFFEKFILDECDIINTVFPVKHFNFINFELVLYQNNETYYINKVEEDDLIHFSNGKLTYGRNHISEHLFTFIDNLEKSMNIKINELNFA